MKWKTIKVHFRYTESDSWIAPYVAPQLPMVCDLVSDPGETVDLLSARLEMGWAVGVALAQVAALEQSAGEFPHVGVGEDFEGYA